MQKIREIQYAVLAQNGQFWTNAAQNDQFLSFPEKNKNVTFLHSLKLAFMQQARGARSLDWHYLFKTLTV